MPSIEWAGYLPYQLSNQWRVLFDLATEFTPESDRTKYLSGYCSLVPRTYGVRHRFLNTINYVHCIIGSFEKHWRTCKRGALPTEL